MSEDENQSLKCEGYLYGFLAGKESLALDPVGEMLLDRDEDMELLLELN